MLPQLKSVDEFNKRLNNRLSSNNSNRYVVLLTNTKSFDLMQDLRRTLRVTKKPTYWFVDKFKELDVRVEYGTIFTDKDVRYFGPLSTVFSDGVVQEYLRSKYDPLSTTFVCNSAKHLEKTMNPETFVKILLQ